MQPSRPGNRVQYLRLHLRAAAIPAAVVNGPLALFLWYLFNSEPDHTNADILGLPGLMGSPVLAAYLLSRRYRAPR